MPWRIVSRPIWHTRVWRCRSQLGRVCPCKAQRDLERDDELAGGRGKKLREKQRETLAVKSINNAYAWRKRERVYAGLSVCHKKISKTMRVCVCVCASACACAYMYVSVYFMNEWAGQTKTAGAVQRMYKHSPTTKPQVKEKENWKMKYSHIWTTRRNLKDSLEHVTTLHRD